MQRMLILKLVSESFNAQDNIKNIILLKYYTIIISLIIQNTACVLTFSRPVIDIAKPIAVIFNADSVQKWKYFRLPC